MRWRILASLLFSAVPLGSQLIAQHATAHARLDEAWRPLGHRADLPRELPWSSATVSLLFHEPRTGIFWSSGNPAALVDDIGERQTQYAIDVGRERGSWRRPLDPGEVTRRSASGTGWTRVSPRLALMGRAVASRESHDPGTRANSTRPYASTPYVTLDTSGSPTADARVDLEGVTSLAIADWRIGAALGLQSAQRQSWASGLVRRNRRAVPAVAAGATRMFGAFASGPYVRWQGTSETIQLIERDAEGTVVQLEGLRDVPRLDVLEVYYRRQTDRVATAGWSFGGTIRNLAWAAFIERSALAERLTQQRTNDPAEDRWNAAEWATGAAYEHRRGAHDRFLLRGTYVSLTGTGDAAADTSGVLFRAHEAVFSSRAEWRRVPSEEGWRIVATLSLDYGDRQRNAPSVPMTSRIEGLTTSAALEVGRYASRRLFAGSAIALGHYSANSAFPAPFSLGQSYRDFILGEYDLLARSSHATSAATGVRWVASSSITWWLHLSATHLAPSGPAPTAFGPHGSRARVGLATGVTLR